MGELYNNELDDAGRHRGFWMIDDHGVKQPIYETYLAYYAWARAWVQAELDRRGQVPRAEDFRLAAAAWLKARQKPAP